MSSTGSSTVTDQQPLPQCGSSDPGADMSLAYRVGSSVLNRLPIYTRFQRRESKDHETEEKVTPSLPGLRTPPPGYYDADALTETKDGLVFREAIKCCSPPVCVTPVVEDDTNGCSNGDTASGGFFPDTGTKRFLKLFGPLLKTLGSEALTADIISSWLPSTISALLEAEDSGGAAPAVVDIHHPSPMVPGDCSCFSCFQQRQMYLLWLQGQHPMQLQQHHHPAICASCQRPPLPARPVKPLLHRLTAAAVLRCFTVALVVYPYVKALLLTVYAWERRNRVCEWVLTGILVLAGRMWVCLMWLFDTGGVRSEVDEQRVRKWIMKVSKEVLGGVIDGMQMGVGVWCGKGKGEGRMVAVE